MTFKAHKGLLIKRLAYLTLFAGAGAGLAFLTQHFWHIQWYSLFVPIAALMLLLGVYHILTVCFARIETTEEGVRLTEGIGGSKTVRIPYHQLVSYSLSSDKLDELLGYVKVTLTHQKGVAESIDYAITLSPKDANQLFDYLATQLAKADHTPKEIA